MQAVTTRGPWAFAAAEKQRRRAVKWNNRGGGNGARPGVRTTIQRAAAKRPQQQTAAPKHHQQWGFDGGGRQLGDEEPPRWSWLRDPSLSRGLDEDESNLLLGQMALRSVSECLEAAQEIDNSINEKLARRMRNTAALVVTLGSRNHSSAFLLLRLLSRNSIKQSGCGDYASLFPARNVTWIFFASSHMPQQEHADRVDNNDIHDLRVDLRRLRTALR